MEKETLEGNKLIAEFMGWTQQLDTEERWYGAWFDHHGVRKAWPKGHEPLLFHSSWDWLMPVVEKIESMGFNVKIEGISCSISRLCEDEVIAGFVCGDRSKKLEIIHSTLIKFIESYYENKNQ